MIIARLTGGLGNQMFQYAAARRLADFHGTELKLDTGFLERACENCTPRPFLLKHFAITGSIATLREVAEFEGKGESRLKYVVSCLQRVINPSCKNPQIYHERFFYFDPLFHTLPDNTYLTGYWQSEKYFLDISEVIRSEFTIVRPLQGQNKLIADQIKGTNSVSLHVRRGDFVSDANVRKRHGFCATDYYYRSLEKMVKQIGKFHLFVFSDEPSWVSEYLDFSLPVTIVAQNSSDEAYLDLHLMSLCRHHIIANSTFSWWGAWLSSSPQKLIIAPERWFSDPTLDSKDLIPPDWQRV